MTRRWLAAAAGLVAALTFAGCSERVHVAELVQTSKADVEPLPVTIPRSQSLTIQSSSLHRAYGIRVQLPPGYDNPANADRRYPVLYLNDAPYNFQVAAGVTHLPMNAGLIEELILVGIGYSNEVGSTESRVRDYTPTVNPASKWLTGGAAGYLQFIERELIPLIEERYRADPKRRALGGHSYGGLFGTFVLLTKPELFQHYILSSPSLWFHRHATWNLEQAYAATHDDLRAKVYLSIGSLENPHQPGGSDYEMVEDVRSLESRLLGHAYPGLELRTTVVEGQNHETVFPIVLTNGLLWHFNAKPDVPFGY